MASIHTQHESYTILTEKESDIKDLNAKLRPQIKTAIFFIIAYIFIGVFSYSYLEHLGLLDSFYFAIVTLTTVGYGDVVPTRIESKLFCCIYMIFGVGLVAYSLGILIERIVVLNAHAEETKLLNGEDCSSSSTTRSDFKQKDSCLMIWKMIKLIALTVIVITIGAVLFIYDQGIEFNCINIVNAVYWSCATITTVGYGDIAPSTESSRLFAIFWLLFSTAIFSKIVSDLIAAPLERRSKSLVRRLLNSTKVNKRFLKQIGGDDMIVSRDEYLSMMLINIGIVSQEEIDEIYKSFDRLDSNHDGTLDTSDILLIR